MPAKNIFFWKTKNQMKYYNQTYKNKSNRFKSSLNTKKSASKQKHSFQFLSLESINLLMHHQDSCP